jgi:hypothetical protein
MNPNQDPNLQNRTGREGNSLDPQACAAFQAELPELIGSGNLLHSHPHLSTCTLCQALLADLETIAEAARQLLAPIEPPDQLWQQIESALREEEEKTEE